MSQVRSRPRMVALTTLVFLVSMTVGPLLNQARAQDQIELRVWDQFTDDDVADEIYAGFMAQHPNITISRETFQTQQMRDVANTAIASGSGPDVIFYDAGPGFAGVLIDAGLLRPLTDYAAQYGWLERLPASLVEETSQNGVFYGMPLETDLVGVYYNQTLFDQAGLAVPQTFDELLAYCDQARAKGYIPIAFGDNPGYQAYFQFSMTGNQTMGPEAMLALVHQHEGRWDTPEIVRAINDFFVTLRDAGCFPDDPNAISYEDGNALFYTGQSLLLPTGSWVADSFPEQMPDMDVRFMPFPELPGAHGRVWVTGVGSAWYITATAKNPDAAAVFIDYLYSQEAAEKWVASGMVLPVDVDLSNVQITPLHQFIIDTLATDDDSTQFGPDLGVVTPARFNDMMTDGFQAILAGDKTPEQQAADLQAAWEKDLAENQATPTP